jgi:hypothetical protein
VPYEACAVQFEKENAKLGDHFVEFGLNAPLSSAFEGDGSHEGPKQFR